MGLSALLAMATHSSKPSQRIATGTHGTHARKRRAHAHVSSTFGQLSYAQNQSVLARAFVPHASYH
eukprot:6050270-Amphidinium_carterae.1